MTDAGIQVFHLVRQWPFLVLTDRVFFNVSGHTTVLQTGFFFCHFFNIGRQWPYHRPGLWDLVWSLSSKSKISKKKMVWQTVVWPLALKKIWSVRPWYGLWRQGAKYVRKKNPVWQTVVWPLGLKKPGLTDRRVVELLNSVWPLVG